MSYQVLARKWRPRSFAELVGQSHVLKALVNALDQNRLHHAYLFTGTRGVGKTTIARIFAKCLNCEQGVSSTPCGQCSACLEIDEGRFVDLIEVDAASRTKVEDTRELLENVQYAPTRGRYKVYLIDEVHMLSTHSFNALLKTLEEPPPHVKFLLATTDPQKLPVTILSRCLQFGLQNMTAEHIVGHLEFILQQEHISYEGTALWQLGRAADGSMRDALSLTDQVIAFGDGQVRAEDVSTMLGTIDQNQVIKVIGALATANASQILTTIAMLAEHAPDYMHVLNDLLSLLHRIAIAQAVPNAVDNSRGDKELILRLAATMTAEDVQLYYQIGVAGKKDLPLAPEPRTGFEMVLLRMLAFRPDGAPVQPISLLINELDESISVLTSSDAELTLEAEIDASVEAASIALQSEPAIEPIAIEHATGEQVTVEQSSTVIDDDPPPWDDDDVLLMLPDDDEVVTESAIEADESTLIASELSGDEKKNPTITTTESCDEIAHPVAAIIPNELAQSIDNTTVDTVDSASAADSMEPIALTQLNSNSWITLYRQLGVSGVTGSIGAHCEFVQQQGDHITLRLNEQRSTLYNDIHRQRVEAKLAHYFNQSIVLTIEIGMVQHETPAQWKDRKIAERLAQAKQSIYYDAGLQQLITHFSATVLDDSIQPIGGLI